MQARGHLVHPGHVTSSSGHLEKPLRTQEHWLLDHEGVPREAPTMTDAPIGLALTRNEVELLIEALDSHEYWQPSEPRWRHSGAVVLPY